MFRTAKIVQGLALCSVAVLLSSCGGGDASSDSRPSSESAATQSTASSAAPTMQASAFARSSSAKKGSTTTSIVRVDASSSSTRAQTVAYTAVFTGKAYYVNNATGLDSNPGTQLKPWRTLARATSARLSSGDALLLACGGKWRETPTFTSTFAPSGNVLIGAYGNCTGSNRPEITGSKESPAGWVLHKSTTTGDVFVANIGGQVATMSRGLNPLILARHPNYSSSAAEFSVSGAGTSQTQVALSLADSTFVSGKDLTNASIVVRTNPYTIETANINRYAPDVHTATLTSPTTNAASAGAGYYIEKKMWMLDAPDEWYHDASAGKLYYFKGRNTDAGGVPLEYSAPVSTITVTNIPKVRLEHIRVTNSGQDGIRVVESGSSTISDVEVINSRVFGINIYSTSGLSTAQGTKVEKSTVVGAGDSGIASLLSGTQVLNNRVSEIGTGPNSVKPVGGIRLSEGNSSAINNVIEQVGFKGIVFANRLTVTITGNRITGACLRLTDCGAIYGWGANTSGQRATVTQNQISSVSSANTAGAVGGAPDLVAGIYLDEGASNVDVVGNYISDVRVGINLHKASYNNILRNQIVAAQDAALRVQSSGSDSMSVRGNKIEGNTYFIPGFFGAPGADGLPKKLGGVGQIWMHQSDAPSMIKGAAANSVTNNVAVHVGDASALRWRLQSGATYVDYESSGWATFAPSDTTARPFRARMATVQGQSLLQNPTMEAPGSEWSTYSYQLNANIATFGYQAVCQNSCAAFTPATTNDVLMQVNLHQPQSSAQLFYVRYRAIGGTSTTASKLEVRENVSPYNPLYMEPLLALPANAERQQEVFVKRTTTQDIRLSIKGSPGTTVFFDDVELSLVDSYNATAPTAISRLVVNSGSTDTSVTCAQLAVSTCDLVDAVGNPIILPMTVPAGSSRMVFLRSSEWVTL